MSTNTLPAVHRRGFAIRGVAVLILTLVVLVATAPGSAAQEPRRWLLAVGNTSYGNGLTRLEKAGVDAQRVADVLAPLQFSSRVLRDQDRRGFERAIVSLKSEVRRDDLVVIYFSGHGFQHDNDNFLVPVDAALDEPLLLQNEATRLSWIWQAFADAEPAAVILLLDACRATPVRSWQGEAKSLGNHRGLVEPRATQAIVGFAAEAGTVAYEGTPDQPTSFFTENLTAVLGMADYHVEDLLMEVRRRVWIQTNHRQAPMRYGMTTGPIYLVPGPVALSREEAAWGQLGSTQTADPLIHFILQFPTGRRVPEARARLAALAARAAAPPRSDAGAITLADRPEIVLEGPLRTSRVAAPTVAPTITEGVGAGSPPPGGGPGHGQGVFADAGTALRLDPRITSGMFAQVSRTTPMILLDTLESDGVAWGRVRTPDGRVGYVEGVERRLQVPETNVSASISFPEGALVPTDEAWRGLADFLGAARTLGARARLSVSVPSSPVEDPVIGRQTAFIRGLSVRNWMMERGVAEERIVLNVQPSRPSADPDAVRSRIPGPVTVEVRLNTFMPPR